MKQLTLAAAGLERYAKTTRRAAFLAEMEGVVPWSALCAADRAILSEAGQWPPAGRGGADAAHLFLAAVVQSVGPGGRGGALRFVGNAALCRHRPRSRDEDALYSALRDGHLGGVGIIALGGVTSSNAR